MDDSALLRQFVGNRSDEAFAELVTRHVNLVYSVAMRQAGNRHQAEEIAQAVFIILAKKAKGLRHDKALSSWLFQTTRLTATNLVRSEIRRHRREQEAQMRIQSELTRMERSGDKSRRCSTPPWRSSGRAGSPTPSCCVSMRAGICAKSAWRWARRKRRPRNASRARWKSCGPIF